MKTQITAYFEAQKAAGAIEKAGKAHFMADHREHERTLYKCIVYGEYFVRYKGDMHFYTPYKEQPYEYMIGRI